MLLSEESSLYQLHKSTVSMISLYETRKIIDMFKKRTRVCQVLEGRIV